MPLDNPRRIHQARWIAGSDAKAALAVINSGNCHELISLIET
jgi:hypothetical protein